MDSVEPIATTIGSRNVRPTTMSSIANIKASSTPLDAIISASSSRFAPRRLATMLPTPMPTPVPMA